MTKDSGLSASAALAAGLAALSSTAATLSGFVSLNRRLLPSLKPAR